MKRFSIAAAAVAAAAVAAMLATSTPAEGCGARCCLRPAGAPVEACMRRNPNTAAIEDFGDGNTMPGHLAVGAGCVATECRGGVGIEWLDGGAP